jgi:hypothetical protein
MSATLGAGLAASMPLVAAFDPATGLSVPANHRWRADLGVTLVGSKVSAINDLIGIIHQTQTSDPSRFTYVASDAGYNGKPVLTGTGVFMDGATDTALASPLSIMIVGEMSASPDGSFLAFANAAPFDLFWQEASGVVQFYDGSTLTSTSTVGSKCAMLVTFDSGNSNLYMNTAGSFSLEATDLGDLWSSVTSLSLGKGAAGVFDFGTGGTGKLAEIMTWPGTLTGGDRTALATYLTSFWGL